MTKFYNPQRTKGLFDPLSSEPFRLSRSKVDLFVQCPRCFYLDQRMGVGRPTTFPMTLNNAVDTLLKKEFDIHRVKKSIHPVLQTYGIDAVPLADERLEEWRDALKRGISYHYEEVNLILRGGVDDVWVNSQGELIIVDYKATCKDEEITLNDDWKIQYKRQMEIYQWLFQQNGFKVSPVGYFVYVNGKTDKEALDGKLEFDVTILPYEGRTDWVPRTLNSIRVCLEDERIPLAGKDCDYCRYVSALGNALRKKAGVKHERRAK